jgi:predicted permease
MPVFVKVLSFLRNQFSSRGADADLDHEVRSHLDLLTQEKISTGFSPKEAQRAARIELGGIEQLKEQVREERLGTWLRSVLADCRFAFRQLRKSRAFTVAVILILALGIGANAAIFSLLDPLLLRKLPVRNASELVWVNSTGTLGPAELSELDTFYAYRSKAPVFFHVLAFSRLAPYEVKHDGQAVMAKGELVSGNYFSALGVYPIAGRLFEETDEKGPATIVLSFDFWRRSFDSDPNAVGKVVSFGDQVDASHAGSSPPHSYTIVGIAPPGFFGTQVGESPDFYMPLGATDLPSQDYWQTHDVTILGRLKPAITIAQAQAALEPLLQELGKTSSIPAIEWQESYAHALLTPAARGLSAARTKYSLPARILMAVVGLLLLIACGNIANLLLARGISRRREITVRLALGASRNRVIRQLLTESILLAIAGTAIGLILGQWMSRLLLASLSTPQFPIVLETGLNWRLLLFAATLLGLTVLVCGIVPALSATRGELVESLKTHNNGSHKSLSQSRMGSLLIVAQVALSTMLLAGAGLLLHSLFNLETFDAGFNRDQVLTVSLNGYSATRTRGQILDFYSRLLERVKQLPGVRSVSYSSFTPMSGKEVGVNVIVEGYTMKQGEVANERFVGVSPGYFETMGIPLLAGREFTPDDTRPHSDSYQATSVAILNRTMARRFFGDSNPIGKHLQFVEGQRQPMEIVGVVADSKYNDLREGATDFFYIPGTHGDLEVRTSVSAATLAAPIRETLRSLDSSVTVTGIKTLRERVDESLHPDRLIASLCAIFSVVALTLTCIGLYGLLAYDAARRTGEIGIRMALGARRIDILRLVVGQGMRWTGSGMILGILAALACGSLVTSLLFGVRKTDPITFLAVAFILIVAAALACYVPARRASRVDPTVALRYE